MRLLKSDPVITILVNNRKQKTKRVTNLDQRIGRSVVQHAGYLSRSVSEKEEWRGCFSHAACFFAPRAFTPLLFFLRCFCGTFHRGESRGNLWELLLHPLLCHCCSLCKDLLCVLVGSLEVQVVSAHRAGIHEDAAEQAGYLTDLSFGLREHADESLPYAADH